MDVTAFAMYQQPVSNAQWSFALASFVASLVQQQSAALPAGDGSTRRVRVLPLLSVGLGLVPAVRQLVPRAYLRVLVYNRDSVVVNHQEVLLSAAAQGGYERLYQRVFVPQAGFVQAYVANESEQEVFFDNVTVEHRQGLQVQENHYDPFGLDLVGLSRSPGLKDLNQYSWNGKEQQREFNLNWHDHGARMYDPALGRWHVIDPLGEKMRRHSPYNYGFDNPTRFTDPDGQFPIDFVSRVIIWFNVLSAQLSTHTERQIPAINNLMQDNSNSRSSRGTSEFLNSDREMAQPMRNLMNASVVAEEVEHKTETVVIGVGRPVANSMEAIGTIAEAVGIGAAVFTEGGSLPLVPTGEVIGKVGGAFNKGLDMVEGNNEHLAEDILYDQGKGGVLNATGKALDAAQTTGAINRTERTVIDLMVTGAEKVSDKAYELEKR